MTADTINTASFALVCDGTAVPTSVLYTPAPLQATLTPLSTLPANASCEARLSSTIKDSASIAIPHGEAWTFTTNIVTA